MENHTHQTRIGDAYRKKSEHEYQRAACDRLARDELAVLDLEGEMARDYFERGQAATMTLGAASCSG